MNEPTDLIDLVDKLLARRAELHQEYERLGLILAEVAEKAGKMATAALPDKPKPRRTRKPRTGLPDPKTFAADIARAMEPRPGDNDGGGE